MTILKRPVSAALAIVLGLVALILGASLLLLREGGWPWHAGIGGPDSTGSTTAEILDDDGTAYQFTGSSTDAHAWLDRKQEDLKAQHGIPAKIAVGGVLQRVGLALVVLGLVRFAWMAAVRAVRSITTPRGGRRRRGVAS